MDRYIKNIIKGFNDLTDRYDSWTIFNDFIAMAAISIRNSVTIVDWEEKEQQYLEIAKKYHKKELDKFAEILMELILALEKESTDVLGRVFMEMDLGSKWTGQFFTPMSVAELMAEMTIERIREIIDKDGYVTVFEPAVGGGAMIIALANILKRHGYNYQNQMVVIAQDIDIKSVYMSYIQFSLLGIPAKVIHGNTLTVELYEEWNTPFYVLNLWDYRLRKGKKKQKEKEAMELSIENNGQLTFF